MKIKQALDMKIYLNTRRKKLYKAIHDVVEEKDIQKILENIDYVCYDIYILECERYIKVLDTMIQSKIEESTSLGLCKCSDELTLLKQAV